MDLASLIGGLGIGSVFTLILKESFENKRIISKRAFEEKRDAYVNYLEVATRSQTMPPSEAIWLRTAAIERVRLCGSANVLELLDVVTNAPADSPRDSVNELILAMRNDLFPVK